MTIQTTNHVNFRGNARQALEFYQHVFGGNLALFTYEDAHNVQNPDEAKQIMWGGVTSDDGFSIMAYDVPSATAYDAGEKPFFVSVRGNDEAEVKSYWDKLVNSGEVIADLAPAQWAPLYGMVKDQFGITWVMDVTAPYAG